MGFDIDILIGDYIDSCNGRPVLLWAPAREHWDRDVLHATDLTKCPRAVALRLSGAEEEERPAPEKRKFLLANYQHQLVYAALKFGGYLVAEEVPVPMPDGWSGTADAILNEFHDGDGGGLHIGDVKNPVAGAKKYMGEFPKPDDILQVSVYSYYLRSIYPEIGDDGEIFYLPLGGASRGLATRFPLVTDIPNQILKFEALVRSGIPDPIEPTIMWQNRRTYTRKDGSTTVSGDIVYGLDWRCRYCRYECPNRRRAEHPTRLCHVGNRGIEDMSSEGRRMRDEVEQFVLDDLGVT